MLERPASWKTLVAESESNRRLMWSAKWFSLVPIFLTTGMNLKETAMKKNSLRRERRILWQ